MPDGRKPGPGGWNRIHFVVDDIAAEVERLRARRPSVPQRHRERPGGRQILLDDPSGNPIEALRTRRRLTAPAPITPAEETAAWARSGTPNRRR